MKIAIRGSSSIAIENVLCLGRTYRAHAKELGNAVPVSPLVFLKSTRCLRPLEAGPLAFEEETFHHEAEVTVLIGRSLALGTEARYEDILALGLGLDLTRRTEQDALKTRGHPWTTAKSFAGAALVSSMVQRNEVANPDGIEFTLHVGGDLRQRGNTSELEQPIVRLLTYLLSFVPLDRGDLIFTGTPSGVGPIRKGDRFELASEQLGTYRGQL